MFKQLFIHTTLLTYLSTISAWACEAFITEVHANPRNALDQDAEFVELYFNHLESPCKILLTLDQDTLTQVELDQFNTPVVIFDHPSNSLERTLPNSTSFTLQLYANGLIQDSIEIPLAIEGSSWEREVSKDRALGRFSPHFNARTNPKPKWRSSVLVMIFIGD